MRSELETVLKSLPQTPTAELPALVAELELVRATALLRMSAPQNGSDELVDVKRAAARLGMSEDYLYRHSSEFPFSRRMGRKLLFSSRGMDDYIRKKTKMLY